MAAGVGSAQVMKFFELIFDAGAAQDCAAEHPRANATDGMAVGLGYRIHVVCRSESAAAGHELVNDARVTGNIFLQKLRHRAGPQIAGARARGPVGW